MRLGEIWYARQMPAFVIEQGFKSYILSFQEDNLDIGDIFFYQVVLLSCFFSPTRKVGLSLDPLASLARVL